MYVVTNPGRTTFYTGVTNDLEVRLIQHFENKGKRETFAGRYYCYHLVYFERFELIDQAIAHEKEIKGWSREKKLEFVKDRNPELRFLNHDVMDWPPKK